MPVLIGVIFASGLFHNDFSPSLSLSAACEHLPQLVLSCNMQFVLWPVVDAREHILNLLQSISLASRNGRVKYQIWQNLYGLVHRRSQRLRFVLSVPKLLFQWEI